MKRLSLIFLLAVPGWLSAQVDFNPGFNSREYAQLLSLSYFGRSEPDTAIFIKEKETYQLVHRSPELGLLNRFTIYKRNDGAGVIDIRGTINKLPSWLANFYAPMIRAEGSIQINDSTIFPYKLARTPEAMVHTGWTISVAHLAPAITEQIMHLREKENIRNWFMIGHSQGGAIAFLLRSYLHYEQEAGRIPQDLQFKTYCSAAPKPGNQHYAYDFEFLTRGGWAYTVVNTKDWVPETPFSIQTVKDFNTLNPFNITRKQIREMSFFKRLAGMHVYNQLDKPTRKSQRRFEKWLGSYVYKQVRKELTQLKEPNYTAGNNYTRAGNTIVLMPDEDYLKKFVEDDKKVFVHHHFSAYYYLLKKDYPF